MYLSNGVSRVRIPPQLRKRYICRNNAEPKKWAGISPGPYYTNGYTNVARNLGTEGFFRTARPP